MLSSCFLKILGLNLDSFTGHPPWDIFCCFSPQTYVGGVTRSRFSPSPFRYLHLTTHLLTHSLTPWWRILFEKLIVTQPIKKFPAFFMEPEGLLTCSQKPATGPYIEPAESSSLHPSLSPSMPRSSKWSLTFGSPNQNAVNNVVDKRHKIVKASFNSG
jgi:hypothetical protein